MTDARPPAWCSGRRRGSSASGTRSSATHRQAGARRRRPTSPRRSCRARGSRTRRMTARRFTAARPPRSPRRLSAASPPGRSVHPRPAKLEAREVPPRPSGRAVQPVAGIQSRRLPARLRIAGGSAYPFVIGKLKKGRLRPPSLISGPATTSGSRARRRSLRRSTTTNCNRGLFFDGEMATLRPHGSRPGAREPPDRGIDGRDDRDQVRLHHPRGRRLPADSHRFCTRAIYSYWREIWLRGSTPPRTTGAQPPAS